MLIRNYIYTLKDIIYYWYLLYGDGIIIFYLRFARVFIGILIAAGAGILTVCDSAGNRHSNARTLAKLTEQVCEKFAKILIQNSHRFTGKI